MLNEYAKTHAQASTSKFNNHIRQCITNAVEEKLIIDNFTNSAVISGTNKTKKEQNKFLNYEDTKRVIPYFMERINPKIPSYYMIILAFTAGLRFGELLGLTWDDIDFDNQEIDINKSYDYKKEYKFIDTKTYSSSRTIFIDKTTINLLMQFKQNQQELFEKFSVTNPYNQVFWHYILGHKDTAVTSRVYLHVIKELREKNKVQINSLTEKIYL